MPVLLLPYIKPIISFISTHWKYVIIAVLTISLCYVNFSDTRFLFGYPTIPALTKQLDEANNNLQICVDGNSVLVNSINQRNVEIAMWAKATADAEHEIQEMQQDIVKIKARNDAKVNSILAQQAPQTCEAAIEYLQDGVEDLKWDE